jgi:hypothetical protein
MSSPRRRGVGNRTSMMVADGGGTRAKLGCVLVVPRNSRGESGTVSAELYPEL